MENDPVETTISESLCEASGSNIHRHRKDYCLSDLIKLCPSVADETPKNQAMMVRWCNGFGRPSICHLRFKHGLGKEIIPVAADDPRLAVIENPKNRERFARYLSGEKHINGVYVFYLKKRLNISRQYRPIAAPRRKPAVAVQPEWNSGEMISLYLSGMPRTEIAAKMGISYRQMDYRLKSLLLMRPDLVKARKAIDFKRRLETLKTTWRVEEIKSLWLSGKRYREIAETLGVDFYTMRYRIEQMLKTKTIIDGRQLATRRANRIGRGGLKRSKINRLLNDGKYRNAVAVETMKKSPIINTADFVFD